MARQFRGVRIPMTIVLLLCLALLAGMWWHGTRGRDFLAPPAEPRLEEIRKQAIHSPVEQQAENGISLVQPGTHQPLVPLPEIAPAVAIDTGDTSRPPTLAEYRLTARDEPATLPLLAEALETKGEIQRALLVHERIIDSSRPNSEQLEGSLRAVRRLRALLPDWQTDPAAAVAVTLQIGTAQTTSETLAPAVRELAAEMARASSGLLAVEVEIHAGSEPGPEVESPPVALWLTGPEGGSASTAVISFTADTPDRPLDDVAGALLQLLRGQIAPAASLHVPEAAVRNEQPAEMLHNHVSRLLWRELGTMLNPP